MLFNHSAWSWNKNLLVLINTPVVKPLSVGENPTVKMCVKHTTQGKLLKTIQVSLSALDILIIKYITRKQCVTSGSFSGTTHSPTPKVASYKVSNCFLALILMQRCAQENFPWDYLIKEKN